MEEDGKSLDSKDVLRSGTSVKALDWSLSCYTWLGLQSFASPCPALGA